MTFPTKEENCFIPFYYYSFLLSVSGKMDERKAAFQESEILDAISKSRTLFLFKFT
jgi:hypothetical protein